MNEPTTANPGSWAKIIAMQQRYEKNLPLFDDRDESVLATIESQTEATSKAVHERIRIRNSAKYCEKTLDA